MSPLLIAAVMGLVEGLTEFLPVSSTGHLILAGKLLGYDSATAHTFDVFIQLGAMLAVVVHFLPRFLGLLRPPAGPGFTGWRGIGHLAATTAPALVLGVLLHGFIKAHLFHPVPVAIALIVGAVWILLTERFLRRHVTTGLDAMTVRTAGLIGLFQCLAMWPGMSRSTSTILGGMLSGLNRVAATEYSFFAAVPVLAAAALFDLARNLHHLTAADIPVFAVGFMVAFVSAWIAIRWLLRFVAGHSLAVFAWYRIALALVVLLALR